MTYLDPQTILVPSQDSVDNNYLQDVVGNKTDSHDGNSLYAHTEILLDHIHSNAVVYPTLADGITVTAGAAWVLGSFIEIVPINTITEDFDIHFISLESLSANDVYELVLYSDADGIPGSEVEVGRCRFSREGGTDGAVRAVPFMTPIIAANSQIKAKLATANGSSTVSITVSYHTY